MNFGEAQPRSARQIFAGAVDISDGTLRNDFLKQACGDDALLRDTVDSLLAALKIIKPGMDTRQVVARF